MKKITEKQYQVIAQKKEQLQTYFNSGYATGLDQGWKVEAGKIYTFLTGRIYNTACSDCIGGFLRPLFTAMKEYEEEQQSVQVADQPAEPINVTAPVEEKEAALIVEVDNAQLKAEQRNNRRSNERSKRTRV